MLHLQMMKFHDETRSIHRKRGFLSGTFVLFWELNRTEFVT